jgi:hypothetical protein
MMNRRVAPKVKSPIESDREVAKSAKAREGRGGKSSLATPGPERSEGPDVFPEL